MSKHALAILLLSLASLRACKSSTALRYFHAAAFGAWSARGVTSVSQTVNAGNPTCTTYSANIGDRGIFVFSPLR